MIVGAEALVRGGSRLASQLGIRPIIVGLTVVSIGTSMPELAVGVVAATEGNGSLAVGNIAGTNMVNLLLILGLSALILPLAMPDADIAFRSAGDSRRRGRCCWALAANRVLSRLDGFVLVLCAIAYTAALIRTSRRESREIDEEFAAEYGTRLCDRGTSGAARIARHVGMLLGGIVIVVSAPTGSSTARWAWLAHSGLRRPDRLTVVAIGTSAPELVTTVVSTVRGERDIAIGNLLGSSIYNILLILGITALVPAHGLMLDSNLVRVDIPIMWSPRWRVFRSSSRAAGSAASRVAR